ncbi:MAG: serine/threonine protein kinase [Planctomycetes bacterium]|nr:serine/threonine protein kinase [Planctomycetota bacterium]
MNSQPAGQGDDAVTRGRPADFEALLAEYLFDREGDAPPPLQHYLAKLPAVVDREAFVDLVQQMSYAEQRLPLRLQPDLVLGGRYLLIEAIGSGGMGQVWKARDQKLQHEVAIKVLNLAATASYDVDRMVERESKLLARLSHPGIVRVQDTGTDGEHRYLVMDLAGGRSLDEVLAELGERKHRAPLTGADLLHLVGAAAPGRAPLVEAHDAWPTVAAKIMVELLRTLEAAHGVSVVHRDLKPANVRITGGGWPVLLDFGISFTLSKVPGALTKAMCGTLQYFAPEQWDSTLRVDFRTDVYQAGLMLYELLVFRRCFPDDNTGAVMTASRTGAYLRPREIDPEVDRVLESCALKAMEVRPDRRYQTAESFRVDVQRHLDGTRRARPIDIEGAMWNLRRFVRKHRVTLSTAAAATVAAVAGFMLSGAGAPRVYADENGAVFTKDRIRAVVIVRTETNGEPRFRPDGPCRDFEVGKVDLGVTRLVHPTSGDLDRLRYQGIFVSLDNRKEADGLAADTRRALDLLRGREDGLTAEEFRTVFHRTGATRGSTPSAHVDVAKVIAGEAWEGEGIRGFVLRQ